MDSQKRTILKSITWRLVAIITTVVIIYIWTGSLFISLGSGLVANILNLALYYIHERIWNKFDFGRRDSAKIDKKKSGGFTLLEILIVIAIIGVISTIVIVSLSGVRAKARDAKRKNDINQIGRFLTFSCLVLDGGVGEYDLNELLDEFRTNYPQYANSIPSNIQDPKTGTVDNSNYIYIVDDSGQCALYANLERDEEPVTLNSLSDPTPGGGKGVLQGSSAGPNGSDKYFQISN